MLTFIISMRARALSQDWDYHCRLLQSTVNSIFAQNHPDFNVVIVCHDVPQISQPRDGAIYFLTVNYPLPQRSFDDMVVDKVLKLTAGVDWSVARGSDYVMFMDADDLVSRRLSEFVAAHKGDNGWFFPKGYSHRYGEWWLRKQEFHHLICGTSHIVRRNLLEFAHDELYRGERVNTLAAAGHANYCGFLKTQGTPLEPLPFSGAVYILHGDSTCWAPGSTVCKGGDTEGRRSLWRRFLSWGKRTGTFLARAHPITSALRQEFSIPKDVARLV